MVCAMCTVVVLWRPGHAWPLLLAANRDERTDRAWDKPGAHWPERPAVVGGRDRLGGGSWMTHRAGLFAAVLNRPGSLGPVAGKRSRGELPLLAADRNSAAGAADVVGQLDAAEYRTFNLVLADPDGVWFVHGSGSGRPSVRALDPGLHMVTAHDPNDRASPRVRTHLPRFQAAAPPDPARDEWQSWIGLLGDRAGLRSEAINVPAEGGFGTVSASLAGVSAERSTVWRFAAGPPDRAAFEAVTLP